jgi:hypothetical protein
VTGVVLVAAVVVVAVVTGAVVAVLVVVIVVAVVVVDAVVEQLASNNDKISKDEINGISIDLIFNANSFLIFLWTQVSNSLIIVGIRLNRLRTPGYGFSIVVVAVLFPPFIIWLFKYHAW